MTTTTHLRELLKTSLRLDALKWIGYLSTAELIEAYPAILDRLDAAEAELDQAVFFINEHKTSIADLTLKLVARDAEVARLKEASRILEDLLQEAGDPQGAIMITLPDGFMPWEGGDCPVPLDSWVEIMCRSGGRDTDTASRFWWGREYSPRPYEIIAYRKDQQP